MLEGKVAGILNERELVVNVGAKAGVKSGMKFKIMGPIQEILDPDNRKLLCTIDREKIRVKIIEVHSEYSVGSTYEAYRLALKSEPSAAYGSGAVREVTRVRTLRPNNESYLLPMDERDSFVNIGDPVFQIEEDL